MYSAFEKTFDFALQRSIISTGNLSILYPEFPIKHQEMFHSTTVLGFLALLVTWGFVPAPGLKSASPTSMHLKVRNSICPAPGPIHKQSSSELKVKALPFSKEISPVALKKLRPFPETHMPAMDSTTARAQPLAQPARPLLMKQHGTMASPGMAPFPPSLTTFLSPESAGVSRLAPISGPCWSITNSRLWEVVSRRVRPMMMCCGLMILLMRQHFCRQVRILISALVQELGLLVFRNRCMSEMELVVTRLLVL